MKPLLEIKNLGAFYGTNVILENISFSVNSGEVLAITGPNGSGKSTLLKTIARIISNNTGSIIFDDINLNDKKTYELNEIGISYFVQEGMVFPSLTINEHFDLTLRNMKLNEKNERIDEVLEEFNILKELRKLRGGNLSNGQRQILSFAMLMLQDTMCWLLDEPTAGLSPENVESSIEFLKKMKDQNKTILIVEHNQRVVQELNNKIYNLN